MSATEVQGINRNACEGRGRAPSTAGVQPKPFQPLAHCSHATLQAWTSSDAPSPAPEALPVTVFDGCNGSSVDLILRSDDTVGKLRERYQLRRPGRGRALNLLYNGKAVPEASTLAQLGVRANAKFITFQKCQGG